MTSKESFSWPTSKGDPIGPVWSYGGKKGMYQAEALRAFAHDLVDRIKEFELPVREAMKAAAGDGLNAFAYCRMLQRRLDGKQREIERLQRHIAEQDQQMHQMGVCQTCAERDRATAEPEEALAQYLKDGETPVQCIERNRADVSAALGLLAESKNNLAQAIRLLHVWRSWAVTPGNEPDPARADILYPLKNGRGELWKEVDTLLSKYPYTSPTKGEQRTFKHRDRVVLIDPPSGCPADGWSVWHLPFSGGGTLYTLLHDDSSTICMPADGMRLASGE